MSSVFWLLCLTVALNVVPGRGELRIEVLYGRSVVNSEIDVAANETVSLRCTDVNNEHYAQYSRKNRIKWTIPTSFTKSKTKSLETTTECDQRVCTSQLTIYRAQFDMTGFYTCYRASRPTDKRSVYIYVNDYRHLVVPYRGNERHLSVAFESDGSGGQTITVPCRPTFSGAKVELWSWRDRGDEMVATPVGNARFEPKIGFKIPAGGQSPFVECRATFGRDSQSAYVTLSRKCHSKNYRAKHLPVSDIHTPLITVEPAEVSSGDTVTLNCSVMTFPGSDNVFVQWTSSAFDRRRMRQREVVEKFKYRNRWRMNRLTRQLVIEGVGEWDEAAYKCWVTQALCNLAKGQEYPVDLEVD